MQQNDTQKIALEVRGISVTLENLEASRRRHDKLSVERHLVIGEKMDQVSKHIALKNQAKGGWWILCTLSSIIGSGLTFFIEKIIKP